MKIRFCVLCFLVLFAVSYQCALAGEGGQAGSVGNLDVNKNRIAPVAIGHNANQARFLRNITQVKRLLNVADSIIIDVRSTANGLTKIPGALSVPVYDLKMKKFLRDRNVILVGSGLNDAMLVEECLKLSTMGFKRLYVLKGGVQALASSGVYKLRSNDLVIDDHWITSRELYVLQAQHADFVVASTLNDQESSNIKKLFESKNVQVLDIDLDTGNHPKSWKSIQNTDSVSPVVVIAGSNDDYDAIYIKMRERKVYGDYYLFGGLEQYKKYIEMRNSFLDKLKRGPVQPAGCEAVE